MTPNESKPNPVVMRAFGFAAGDGVPLAGTWFLPGDGASSPSNVIVVATGGGIPARYYRGIARHLATKGAAVLCFDYRGIGESRHGSLKGLEAGIEIWGRYDLGGALAHAKATFPGVRLGMLAHSIGTLLVGAAPDAGEVSRLVLFAPHTAYWGDYRGRWRWLLYLTWHVLMPTVTKMVGYFPGRALKLGEDLPKGLALDWARRLKPELMPTEQDKQRFGEIVAGFDRLRATTLAISITDDAFAPPEAGRRLLAVYSNLAATHETVIPSDLGFRSLGHMAFLQRRTGPYFWDRAAAWLLQTNPDGRASAVAAQLDVPPSGTKGLAPAGSATSS